MVQYPETGELSPVNFISISKQIPELVRFDLNIETVSFAPPLHSSMDRNIAILKKFPGISEKLVHAIYNIEDLRAVIMETYGAGNAPTAPWFISLTREAASKGIIILNVTQCAAGRVDMNQYKTGKNLIEAGVLSGYDITSEATVAKLMFLLSRNKDNRDIKEFLHKPLRGEIN